MVGRTLLNPNSVRRLFWLWLGVIAFGLPLELPAGILYVDQSSSAPLSPYGTWATAAATIQDAIDSASDGDLILVTNGVYGSGGKVMAGDLTNRVALDRAVTVQSVNGPTATVIEGQWDATNRIGAGAIRAAWLTNGAVLNGFTLRFGATRSAGDGLNLQSGGGVWCASTNATVPVSSP